MTLSVLVGQSRLCGNGGVGRARRAGLGEMLALSFSEFGHYKPLLRALEQVEERVGIGPAWEPQDIQSTKQVFKNIRENDLAV